MFMSEIILKKRNKSVLSKEEIDFVIQEYSQEQIPDYQMSALLMAIVLNGMNDSEISYLTNAMMHSGEIIDLSAIQGVKVDKHSTGGVGDKTTLVLAPLVAACGVKVAKMSGRGLGHTGGTLDKLEAIPNLKVGLSVGEFINQVNEIGLAVIGQTSNLVPADKKMYALRDVTATVDSVALIASSIMSKKLATGSDCILLDVKYGSGAFFEKPADAIALAKAMVAIGRHMGRDTRAMLSNMNQPLGRAIGNSLEIKEVISTLQGNGPQDLVDLCLEAGAIMLQQAGMAQDPFAAKTLLTTALSTGSAYEKWVQLVTWQGGDVSFIHQPDLFPSAKNIVPVLAHQSGYVVSINAHQLGEAAMHLGAGRAKKEDAIDYSAGIILEKKCADKVAEGEVLAWVHTNKNDYHPQLETIREAYTIQINPAKADPLIYTIINE